MLTGNMQQIKLEKMLQEIKCVLIVLLLFIPFICTCGNFLCKVDLHASLVD